MPTTTSFGQLLENRVRHDPAQPLLVWYSPDDQRVELSALTFANWVDKTVNLLGDLGWDEAPVVAVRLLASRPLHWVSLVWVAAVWQAGGRVVLAPSDEAVEVVVLGPDGPHQVDGLDTIACSLHPLGLGFADDLPSGVIDYRDVLGQPDVHTPATTPGPDALAWSSPAGTTTHAELLLDVEPVSGRAMLTEGDDAYRVTRAALLAPLLGGGSAVLVEGGPDSDRLSRIAGAERTEL